MAAGVATEVGSGSGDCSQPSITPRVLWFEFHLLFTGYGEALLRASNCTT
jgi:hypothetical protein